MIDLPPGTALLIAVAYFACKEVIPPGQHVKLWAGFMVVVALLLANTVYRLVTLLLR